VERKLKIALISGNRDLAESLADLIRESVDFVKIDIYWSESSFLEAETIANTDVIVSERIDNVYDWKSFRGKITEGNPDALLIFIVADGQKEITMEMIRSDIYDILTPSSLTRIQSLMSRIIRDIDDKSNLRYLSMEKDFNDHIADNSRSMLSIINRDYVYVKVNSTFCNAHNVEVNSIVGKSLSEIWGKDTFKDKIQQNIDLCFAGNTIRYEANLKTPSFGDRSYEVIFRPISRGTGEITHLLAETFDITDLKHSQMIVNEMEEEFKKLKTNLPIGFLRCKPDGTIIHANNAFLKIMECDDEESLSDLNIEEFYTEKGLFHIHMHQLMDDRVKTFGRVPFYTFSGNEIACRLSGFIVTTGSGEPSYIDFAFEDSSRELMLENRLLQAQKLETIGSLAGGLAHDFNNILTTISGYSEMLLDEVPKLSPTAEKLGKIMTAVKKARSLTNQILTFSRQVEQEKIPVNVYEVLTETIGFVQSGIPANIRIDAGIQNNNSLVYADPTQLFRVFLNLMTNAIQSMETSGGILTVNLAIVEGNLVRHELNKNIVADEYALITFEDTGVGMDPTLTQRIFEPYFTTRDVGKGTGLGLSVVHGIISEIEGEILVSSRKDKGSLFSVYLPVTKEYNDTPEKEHQGKNVLLITGNKYESRILSMALESTGCKLLFASDRNRFFNILSEGVEAPDLIIYMDDSEEIKAEDLINIYSEKNNNTPLILISNDDQFTSAEVMASSGIVKQILNKPVSLKEIRNAIQTLLS
jgi:signal transduction histidine kinase/CheY-like chemotaxis protein